MVNINEIENLIQASYGAAGYHVSRVTGKAVIVTLPASGQNIEELMVELRARGCSVHFETLADETPPKVELYVHPGSHQAVSDDDDDDDGNKGDAASGGFKVARDADPDPFMPAGGVPPSQSKPRSERAGCCTAWTCVGVLASALLLALAVIANFGSQHAAEQA